MKCELESGNHVITFKAVAKFNSVTLSSGVVCEMKCKYDKGIFNYMSLSITLKRLGEVSYFHRKFYIKLNYWKIF